MGLKSHKGITLLEILVVGTLGILLAYLSGKLLVDMQKSASTLEKNSLIQDQLGVLSGHLQKYMSPGDFRFWAFTGKGATDRTLARFLIPQVGVCANLDDTNCPEDSAFLYVHYNKLAAPGVSTICTVDSGASILIDTKNMTYGPSILKNSGFDIQKQAGVVSPYPTGYLPLAQGDVIGIMNPPSVTLWKVDSPPSMFNVSQNAAPDCDFTPSLPSSCVSNLQRTASTCNGSIPQYDLSGLYKLRVSPLLLTQFTGGNTVSNAEINSSYGFFPMRIVEAKIRSIGKENDQLVINECKLNNTSLEIECNLEKLLSVPSVERLRILQIFELSFDGSPATRYQFSGGAVPRSLACTSPECELLPVNNSGLKVFFGAGESFEALDPTGFSFLKQEALSRLRFQFTINQKEQSFDVIFPKTQK